MAAAPRRERNLNNPEQRARWRAGRLAMEASLRERSPGRGRSVRRTRALDALMVAMALPLKLTGIYGWGRQNALDLQLRRVKLEFADLPADLEGFTILHLSDFHVDYLPEASAIATALVAGLEADLCVLTGDERGPVDAVLPALEELLGAVSSRHGVFAVLGNHDRADLVAPLEGLGLTVLLNESRTIAVGRALLRICGTDDVHKFYTEAAPQALRQAPDGFRVALVHSADLALEAAAAGFRLYLAGHTHGGQICLPGGRVIVCRQDCGRRFAAGLCR